MSCSYDKFVKVRVFKQGNLVIILRRTTIATHCTQGKFEPKWEGPYIIEKVYDGGAYLLIDHNGCRPMSLISDQYLKRYYA